MIHVLHKLLSNLELSWWCFILGGNWSLEKGEVDPSEQTNTHGIQHSPGFSCREENPVSRKILKSRWLAELSGQESQGNTHRLHSVSHTCNWAINVPTVWFSSKKLIWVRGHWHGGQGWGHYQEATTEHNRLVWWLLRNSMWNNAFSLSRCPCQISGVLNPIPYMTKGDFAHPIKSRLQPYPGLPPGPSLINLVFKSKEDKMTLWIEGGIQNDCLWSWGKEASEQEYRKPLEARRGKETDFPIQAPERNVGFQCLDLHLVRPSSDLSPLGL